MFKAHYIFAVSLLWTSYILERNHYTVILSFVSSKWVISFKTSSYLPEPDVEEPSLEFLGLLWSSIFFNSCSLFKLLYSLSLYVSLSSLSLTSISLHLSLSASNLLSSLSFSSICCFSFLPKTTTSSRSVTKFSS